MPALRLVSVPLALLALAACDGTTRRPRPPEDDPLTVETRSATTDTDGRFTLEVEVPADADHFQVTGIGDRDEWVYLEELWSPAGDRVLYWEDWWASPQSLTNAIYGDRVMAFDWPSRDVDGTLAPGTWTIVGSMTDANYYYATRADLSLSTALKTDDDFANGTVAVRIVWADGVDGDPAVVDAVEQAVERWREVWGTAGIALEERYVTSDLDPHLAFAWRGDDPEVEARSQDKRAEELQLIVGEQVRNDLGTYGIAGGIPGTILPSGSTYVVLSWLAHAGRNAQFDADEIRLMGETMAHEVGHYTGLFHPVESNLKAWDALDDTVECSSYRACENELGTNVMYPYSICGGGYCLATDQITADQQGVMQRYVGAL